MGCAQSLINKTKESLFCLYQYKLKESIDYSEYDSILYYNLFMYYYHYNPLKLKANPFFIYMLMDSYNNYTSVLWIQLTHTYGPPENAFLNNPKIFEEYIRFRIIKFYENYNPGKLQNSEFVDELIKAYRNKEQYLFQQLQNKYGPEFLMPWDKIEIKNPIQMVISPIERPPPPPPPPPPTIRPELHIKINDDVTCKQKINCNFRAANAAKRASEVAQEAANSAELAALDSILSTTLYEMKDEDNCVVPEICVDAKKENPEMCEILEKRMEEGFISPTDEWDFVSESKKRQ